MPGRFLWTISATLGALVVAPGWAAAQDVGSTSPRGTINDPEFQIDLIDVGPFTFETGGELRIEYDDNVFAEPADTRGDGIVTFRPYAKLEHRTGHFVTGLSAAGNFRRYIDTTSENSDGASVLLTSSWRPRPDESFTVSGSWDRVAEDRGDPEARRVLGIGPRVFEILGGSVGYRRRSSNFLFEALGEVRDVDALGLIDDQRDYKNYSGRATVGFRTGGPFYVTATGYFSRLDFRVDQPVTGADRDFTTLGALAGIEFADGGLIEGSVSAGIFKLKTDNPAAAERTGFSLRGQLTYRPRERTAIQLDLFNGDVTSFRGGATSRIDTTVGLTVKQEVRHNFFVSVGVDYERTNFFSLDSGQVTWGGTATAELLVNRHTSLIATLSYHDRASDIPLDEFGRFASGIGVRVRF